MTHYTLVYVPDKDEYWILPVGQALVKKIVHRGEKQSDYQFLQKAKRHFDKFISENTLMKKEPVIIKTAILY